jgi:hypothetical protein
MLAVPAAILYTREMNSAISLGIKSQSNITLDGYLQREIISWRFLDNWKGKLKWKSENHIPLQCSLMHQLLNGAAFSKSTEDLEPSLFQTHIKAWLSTLASTL